MCGKANPADLDECQYCQARLRPIWASAPAGDDLSEDQASDLPEWLKSLRMPGQEQSEQTTSSQEGQEALPDWLGELRKQPGETAGSSSEEISDDLVGRTDDSASSWMQDFLGESDLPKDEIISDQRGDVFQPGNVDWISRISAEPIGEEQPQESAETLDWLAELEQAAPDLESPGEQGWHLQQASPQPFEASEPLPDWLAEEKPGAPELPGQEMVQDLFESESVVEPGQPEQPATQAELPDWLQQASTGVQDITTLGDGASSEWTRLGAAESVAPEPTSDETVNWLAGGDEELPAWLFEQPSENEPAEPIETLPPATTDEAELAQEDLAEWPVTQEEDLPEWLKPLQEAPEEESPVPSSAAEALAPAGLFTEEPLGEEDQPLPAAEEPEIFPLTSEDESIPWLVGATAAMAGAELVLGQDDEENPGWLEQLESIYGELSPNVMEEPAASEGVEDLEPGSALPIWLAKESEEEELAQEPGAEGEEELTRADLPSWLQAMKPVGVTAAAAALTGESEPQQIEGAGPLAGLRGALPAEPDVSQAQKPPVYSIKLQVTEPQQAQAELLGSLVEAEGRPQALPRSPVIRSQDVVRLLFAVLLIFPVLFVMLTGFPQFGLPMPAMEVNEVREIVDGLAPGSPVLLAVDYQPGFSGEMDAVALPVVQHLYERGAYLALVSTISTGPVQAEHLISQVQSTSGAPLQIQANTVNLGYIPGGAAGLLGFAQSPRDVIPTNLQGERVWETAGLQGVASLEKFALVVVATENPDVSRYWIEQVQPQLGATPMVMLLSAQAEPMVWPYYDAWPPQVQGLVGGLAGGAAYLVQGSQSGEATQFWSPYAAGVLIAVVLMILGGIFYLILAQIARRQEKAGGEKRP
jgi:hypothetical protein